MISPSTLRCRETVPSLRSTSSRDIGWHSLLLDVHSGISSTAPYVSVPTPDPRIGVSVSGRYNCDYFVGGKWRRDRHAPGTICVHRTGQPEQYRFPRPDDPGFTMALIYIPVGLLEAAVDEFARPGQPAKLPTLHSVVDRDPAITQLALALMGAAARQDSDLYAQASAAWLAMHLLSRYGPAASTHDNRSAGAISDRRLARVVELVSTDYAKPLTLDQLAAEACVSKFHFTRLFREAVGQSPYRYLNDVRLEAARRMLATTELPPSEIATMCGFRSRSSFSNAFSRRFGTGPTTYRSLS